MQVRPHGDLPLRFDGITRIMHYREGGFDESKEG